MSLSPKHEAEASIPDHPYRDTALFYGVLAVVIVVLSAFTSTGLAKGLLVGAGFWLAATAWSWWRFRVRIRRRDAAAAAAAAADEPSQADEGGTPR